MHLFRNTDINNQPVNLNRGDNNNPSCHQSQLINGSHHALRYEYIMIWIVYV